MRGSLAVRGAFGEHADDLLRVVPGRDTPRFARLRRENTT